MRPIRESFRKALWDNQEKVNLRDWKLVFGKLTSSFSKERMPSNEVSQLIAEKADDDVTS